MKYTVGLFFLGAVNFLIALLTDLGQEIFLSGENNLKTYISLAVGSFVLAALIWVGTCIYQYFMSEHLEYSLFSGYWKILMTAGVPVIGGYFYNVPLPGGYPSNAEHWPIATVVILFTMLMGWVGRAIMPSHKKSD